ncbi:carboxylating nicotinate-nucleotide diphosphorylase [Smaragdicoccus niigatensis]|uniref:carboxylating nicotinate-nucleotide diphosphorylase n=1 Tax=Smaragdicoccus niigatensis TaxID=359359 RepID=UPI000363BBDE|nr:carboxylating nicotinate-nucleotide diphosphorylase [Smaragdicoccus niigatensis]
MSELEWQDVDRAIAAGLDEDLRYGPDITSLATVPADLVSKGAVITRQAGTVAGIDVALRVFDTVLGAGNYAVLSRIDDGTRVQPRDVVLTIEAPVQGMLTAERTMLNLLCHMSGIATATSAWVDAVDGTTCKIRDSRKTLPGLRALEKYAVRAGGGVNHRMGLGDEALIKDNHIVAAGSPIAALRAVRASNPTIKCEIEVDRLEYLDEILPEKPELVLLDNMPVWMTQMAVQRRNKVSPETKLESSGGLTLDVAADYAGTGVDFLAVGALTHSVKVLDLGLDM